MKKEKRNGELLEQPAESLLTITKTAADQKEQLRL